jgi:hypothetical protein
MGLKSESVEKVFVVKAFSVVGGTPTTEKALTTNTFSTLSLFSPIQVTTCTVEVVQS